MEERFLGNDALPDLRLDEGHLLGYPKIQGGRHQGGPNLSYRPDLYNHFRGMIVAVFRGATTLPTNRGKRAGRGDSTGTVRRPRPPRPPSSPRSARSPCPRRALSPER